MPINAGAIGIQPVGPQRPAGGVDGIQRRDDGTSGGFRPHTEISLKTAIEDLAATLGRIASQEKYGIAHLPTNIGQVVRNILQQSLSMEETLMQGIGSTIESQRFSTEQLSIFARMLAQIGALAEKGFSMELSDETKALLTQFKNLVVASEGGRAFEPVLMSKSAFELVDSKTPEQLPPALLEMLTQLGASPSAPVVQPQSESMQFLKQIVQLLMPKPNAEGNSSKAQQSAQVQQQARPTATQQMLNSVYRQFDAPYAHSKQSAENQPATGQTQLSAPVQAQTQPAPANGQTQLSAPVQNQEQPAPANTQQATGQTQLSAPVQTQEQPAPANIQQATGQTQSSAPVQTQTQPAPANIQQATGQTPSPAPVQNQEQPAPANIQQATGQTPSPAPVQNQQAQPAPANIQQATGQTQLSAPVQTQTQPAPANIQQATGQTQSSAPVQNQAQPAPANIQPATGQTPSPAPVQNQAQPAPANIQPATGQTQLSAPVQNQEQPAPANIQPATGQTQLSAPVQTQTQPAPANIQRATGQTPSPALVQTQTQPAPANIQQAPVQNQPAAKIPRDEFTVSLPKKPQVSPVDEDFIARQRELMAQMQFAKTQLLQQPLQNTPQTTDALKNLAQFLMRNPASAESMSQRETTLLQNFVNNQQTVLPRDEARHLQNLLRLCQQNVPAVVQQAAVQHKLPDLPRLWAFMQLCDMASLPAHMSARALKRAAREVSDFSNVIRQAMGGDNTSVQNQRSFQMMLPLYLGENISSYPTYLSVYDETARDKETGAEKKETWLRICVLTDNIGAAELVFRVYEKTQLDMRFYFSQGEVAEDFKSYVASLRDFIGGTSFSIGEIRIGSIGEKMLLAQ